ncbi:A-agglutinin anchorage subunit-like [Lycium ferocissimum]|uniref:A-agglutinin anchorage subunit-like n=1 Tax=Lycium ferocissimum TaxID=112874 RepID=UPI00281515BB|nr:A-agglutinin anchorage subunit-like [Lycium ferocissimum]
MTVTPLTVILYCKHDTSVGRPNVITYLITLNNTLSNTNSPQHASTLSDHVSNTKSDSDINKWDTLFHSSSMQIHNTVISSIPTGSSTEFSSPSISYQNVHSQNAQNSTNSSKDIQANSPSNAEPTPVSTSTTTSTTHLHFSTTTTKSPTPLIDENGSDRSCSVL